MYILHPRTFIVTIGVHKKTLYETHTLLQLLLNIFICFSEQIIFSLQRTPVGCKMNEKSIELRKQIGNLF